MPSLAELQRAMRTSLVANDATVCAFILSDGIAAADRLDIYRNTFASVATRALRLNHPAVAKLVGEDFFDATARAYVAKRPPASAWLDRYGAGFAGFLARWPAAAALDYLPDVARLEWSVSHALHAPDAPALGVRAMAAFAAFTPDAQAALRFKRHSSVRMLRTRSRADAIWRATLIGDDDALAAIDPDAGPRWLLVERSPSGIEVTALSEEAWRFTRDLCTGHSLQDALDRIDTFATLRDHGASGSGGGGTRPESFDPVALLGAHLVAGRFVAYRVAGMPPVSEPEENAK